MRVVALLSYLMALQQPHQPAHPAFVAECLPLPDGRGVALTARNPSQIAAVAWQVSAAISVGARHAKRVTVSRDDMVRWLDPDWIGAPLRLGSESVRAFPLQNTEAQIGCDARVDAVIYEDGSFVGSHQVVTELLEARREAALEASRVLNVLSSVPTDWRQATIELGGHHLVSSARRLLDVAKRIDDEDASRADAQVTALVRDLQRYVEAGQHLSFPSHRAAR